MDAVFGLLSSLAAVTFFVSLAAMVKPFWVFKSRKAALKVGGGALAAALVVSLISPLFAPATPAPVMPDRPATITEDAWAERIDLCRRAALRVETCVADDAKIESARGIVADVQARALEETERATKEAEDRAASERRVQDIAWLERTKDAIRAQMRDPSSVEFRNVAAFRADPSRRAPTICGEVNGRNGFGGMTGFQGFIAAGPQGPIFFQQQIAPGEFAESQREFCVNGAAAQ
jgi:hypothetical protein